MKAGVFMIFFLQGGMPLASGEPLFSSPDEPLLYTTA